MVMPPTLEVMSQRKRFLLRGAANHYNRTNRGQSMSNAVFNRVRHAQLTTSQKILLLLLADYADDTGCTNSYAPIERLAFESCLSRRAVINNLKELEQLNVVLADKITGATSVYHINPDYTPESRKTDRVNPFATRASDDQTSVMRCTGAADAPVQQMHQTRASDTTTRASDCIKMSSDAPIPSITIQTSNNHPDTPKPKAPKIDPLAIELPTNIKPELWAEFVAMRRDIKKPVTTQSTIKGLLNQIAKCADANASLQQSIDHCWQGVFEVKPSLHQPAFKPAFGQVATRAEPVAPQMPNAQPAPQPKTTNAKADAAAFLASIKQ